MSTATAVLAAELIALAACHRDTPKPPADRPKPAVGNAPLRGAVGDTDLRVMLSEIASSKACEILEGRYLPLRAPDRPAVRTGTLWVRRCQITNDGTQVTFDLGGTGWQWADQTKHEAGAKFVVREYVKFDVHALVHGELDLAYDRDDHVLSIWYSPSETPQIELTPIGKLSVDRDGAWASIVGGIGSLLGESPDKQGTRVAAAQGTQHFEQRLATGLTVAVGMCTGYQRITLGRAPKGSLGPPEPGDATSEHVELEQGGLAVFGPQPAPDGMTIDVDSDAPVRVGMACADQAAIVSDAFAHSRARQPVHTLAQADVRGHARLHAKPQHCPVTVIAEPLAPHVVMDWQRPPAERARALGGSIVRCRGSVTR